MKIPFLKKKPIGPTAHGISDYGFAAVSGIVPTLLGLNKPARYSALALTAVLLGYTMTTDYKPAVTRKIPFKKHRLFDIGNLAALLVVPALAGGMKEPKARRFFGGLVAMGIVNVLLTDWDAG